MTMDEERIQAVSDGSSAAEPPSTCPFCTLRETRTGFAVIVAFFLMPILLLLIALISTF